MKNQDKLFAISIMVFYSLLLTAQPFGFINLIWISFVIFFGWCFMYVGWGMNKVMNTSFCLSNLFLLMYLSIELFQITSSYRVSQFDFSIWCITLSYVFFLIYVFRLKKDLLNKKAG